MSAASLLLAAFFVAPGCQPAPTAVDLLMTNARIQTVDSVFTTAEALAVKNGRIVAMGRTADLQRRYRATQTVDAHGQFLYPGLQDAHCHFYYYAIGLRDARLGAARSWAEAVTLLRAHRRTYPAAAWLTGTGWDETRWPGQPLPTRAALDQLFPDVPILLWRVDGHAALVNGAALRLADLTPASRIAGGRLEIGLDGQLTGLLTDNAATAVDRRLPPPAPAETAVLLREAEQRCFAVGLTSVANMGITRREISRLDSLYQRRELQIRLHAYALLSDGPTRAYYLRYGPLRGERLSVPGFKVFVDGALGSRGACLRHPYADAPTQRGLLRLPPDTLRRYAAQVAASRMQLAAHAIGDSTNHLLLNLYGAALGPHSGRRWRIEHAQIVSPADVALFGRYGVIPSVQPAHATSDMAWAGQRLGPARLPTAYAYAALLGSARHLALGSDFPVEDINPLFGYYAAVTRQDAQGHPAGGFLAANRLSRRAALCGMTTGAAYANFDEQETGQIKPGMRADFVLLDVDLLTAPMLKIRAATVQQTWVNGMRVH